MSISLLDETMQLLDQDDRPLREIAEAAGVNYHWLGKLKQRKFDNPGVLTIERLNTELLRRRASIDRHARRLATANEPQDIAS